MIESSHKVMTLEEAIGLKRPVVIEVITDAVTTPK